MSDVIAAPDPRLTSDLLTRIQIDRSCRQTVVWFYTGAVFWLLAGSLLALVASLKMHLPFFLDGAAWLTFGRVRPAHLNTMIFGWASMAGIGTLLWLQARLSRVRLPYRLALPATAIIWNLTVAAGAISILSGYGTSIEWLEFPPWALGFFGFCLAIIMAASFKMFRDRKVAHTYVSQWYLFGAVFWFPFLYTFAVALSNAYNVTGVARATANWWFAHNVLGLWLTPIGLASAYFFIPKVIGRPIHSYHLSLLGFWSLALFYNWAGTHHLIGGPLPAWVITVGIVGSIMMLVPVITVAINHHLTMVGNFHYLKTSPTLRFVVFGAMSYTAVSIQGSLQALRSVNEVTHFTQYTIAHAHLGVYAFFTMIMFGSMYYVLPRLTRCEWSSAPLIKLHFWTSAVGVTLYFVSLTWAGWNEGRMMNDASIPFLRIVEYTKPFLASRSVAGTLMTIGHVTFAFLVLRILRGCTVPMLGPTLLGGGRRKRVRIVQRSGGNL
jgi:cytochrome c oxidase cbb3-type subunit 1